MSHEKSHGSLDDLANYVRAAAVRVVAQGGVVDFPAHVVHLAEPDHQSGCLIVVQGLQQGSRVLGQEATATASASASAATHPGNAGGPLTSLPL